jgi:hypothetical protein
VAVDVSTVARHVRALRVQRDDTVLDRLAGNVEDVDHVEGGVASHADQVHYRQRDCRTGT